MDDDFVGDSSIYAFGVWLGSFLTISSVCLSVLALVTYCVVLPPADTAIALSITSVAFFITGAIIWFCMTYEGWE